MSVWSRQRQLAYLSIPLVLVLAVASLFYVKYIYATPTCFDGLKNGNETGVDCGGSCSLLCSGDSLAPVVLWAKSFNVTGNIWNAVAYIQNPNSKSSAKNVSYRFQLYDENNNLITTQSGQTDIPRNETFAVFGSSINTNGKTVKRTEFEFSNTITWYRDTSKEPDLNITNNPIQASSTSPKITGTISNPNLTTVGPIELVALIFDGRQNALGASKTIIDPLSKGQTAQFVFTWPHPFPVGVDVCEVPSDVMLVLDRSGSMASISLNPPQPLTDVKNVASDFISQLQYGDSVGVVSFATAVSNPVDANLTTNFDSAKQAIQAIAIASSTADRNTNIGDALNTAAGVLASSAADSSLKKVIILLTDGDPTDPVKAGQANYPTLYAENAATEARSQGIDIFTIGLGQQVNSDVLQNIAGIPTRYFSAPDTSTLASIYKSIASSICTRKPDVIEILSRVLQ